MNQKLYSNRKGATKNLKTLQEFRTILLCQILIIYTDNKNLKYNNFNTDILLIWIIILEEYGPDI